MRKGFDMLQVDKMSGALTVGIFGRGKEGDKRGMHPLSFFFFRFILFELIKFYVSLFLMPPA